MFIAGKFTCTFPETEDVEVICESSSQFDWIAFGSMIGTVGATFVALAFGIHSLVETRKMKVLAASADRKKRYERNATTLVDLLGSIYDALPVIDREKILAVSAAITRLNLDAENEAQRKMMNAISNSIVNLSDAAREITAYRTSSSDLKHPEEKRAGTEKYIDETFASMVDSIRNDVKMLFDAAETIRDRWMFSGIVDLYIERAEGHKTHKKFVSTAIRYSYKNREEGSHITD